MLDDQSLDRLIRTNFDRVLRMFNYALQHGLTTRDELLSDYQYGITKSLSRAKRDVKGTTIEQFLHYHGVCEAQSQFRIKKQRTVLNACTSGHTYAFNKGRKTCPKCDQPFEQIQKFEPIDQNTDFVQPFSSSNLDFEALQNAIGNTDLPFRQKKVLKALVSSRIILEEEHILSATARATGISRQRIAYIVNKNRDVLKQAIRQSYT